MTAVLLAESGLSECGREQQCWRGLSLIVYGVPVACLWFVTIAGVVLTVRHLKRGDISPSGVVAVGVVGVLTGGLFWLQPAAMLIMTLGATAWLAIRPPADIPRSGGLISFWTGLFAGAAGLLTVVVLQAQL